MPRTLPSRDQSRLLPFLRPAGGWLIALMVLSLVLPAVCAFGPRPQGRDIQLEPSTTDFGDPLPGALIETASQQKQPPAHCEPLAFSCGGRLPQPPALALLSGLAATAAPPRTTAHALAFSARPPPRA